VKGLEPVGEERVVLGIEISTGGAMVLSQSQVGISTHFTRFCVLISVTKSCSSFILKMRLR